MSSPQDLDSPLGRLFGLSPKNQDDPHDSDDDSDDDEANNVAYNALINNGLGSDNPIYEEDDDIGDAMEQLSIEPTHTTVRALKLLSEAGITLSGILNSALFGDESIRSHPQVVASQTGLFKSSVLPRSPGRIRKPPQMRVRGQAHQTAKSELESRALETLTEIL
ncbi:hypothetical protein BDV93DRAFT_560635 [Ceratobasidium sp. AG-I]|nr:hypothetical protein BDV93DRAFT_560635 [Ceratobasidium sp. AG-I]